MIKYKKLDRGYYTKNTDSEGNVIVSFTVENCKHDSSYETRKILDDNFNHNINMTQSIEDRENMDKFFEMSFYDMETHEGVKKINKYFDNVLISRYNIYGKVLESLLIHFDFENSKITITNKEGINKIVKVEKWINLEYRMKSLKTKIKHVDGIKGVYIDTLNHMHICSVFNSNGMIASYKKILGIL